MVEDWKDVNSFEFPLQKLGVKTKVLSQNNALTFLIKVKVECLPY